MKRSRFTDSQIRRCSSAARAVKVFRNRRERATWTPVEAKPSLHDLRMGGVGRWIMPLLVPCISTGMIAMSIAGSS
jgi:hypothetical protein